MSNVFTTSTGVGVTADSPEFILWKAIPGNETKTVNEFLTEITAGSTPEPHLLFTTLPQLP